MRAHMCLWHNRSCFSFWNLLLHLHPGSYPLCEGCVRLWFWFLSFPVVCSWFMPGQPHAQTQLLFNNWQISLSATLLFPLPSLSLLSLQLKFNTEVPCPHNTSPLHLFAWHATWSSSFPSSLNIFFYSALFSVLIFGQAVQFFLRDIDRKQTGPIKSPS